MMNGICAGMRSSDVDTSVASSVVMTLGHSKSGAPPGGFAHPGSHLVDRAQRPPRGPRRQQSGIRMPTRWHTDCSCGLSRPSFAYPGDVMKTIETEQLTTTTAGIGPYLPGPYAPNCHPVAPHPAPW